MKNLYYFGTKNWTQSKKIAKKLNEYFSERFDGLVEALPKGFNGFYQIQIVWLGWDHDLKEENWENLVEMILDR